MASATNVRHFVVGGVGFLGSHIVSCLKARGEQHIGVLDISSPPSDERVDGVDYFTGSITDKNRLLQVFSEWKPDVLYHTASPIHGLPSAIYYEVNEKGTNTLIAASRSSGITKIIYTSSTGVVWTGAEFAGVTEEDAKVPSQGYDAYHHTKAIGEKLVLDQNGVDGMTVVVLRPCGMTGERDKQLIWKLAKILEDGQQNVQIGDNLNLVDYAYVGNVAHAHLLAADCLISTPETVAGQVFFITNGSPLPNWSFNRLIWKELGDPGTGKLTILPRWLGMFLAIISEGWSKLTGKPTEFNRFAIRFITGTQWYSIDKARKLLGYEPPVPLEEGIRRTVAWWKAVGAEQRKKSKND